MSRTHALETPPHPLRATAAGSGQPPRVAVVGAGWAGMAAAVELAAAGVGVTVYEAARMLGGRARRVEIGGVALDNGLHILVGAYREALRLIDLVRPPGAPPGLLRMPLRLRVEPDFRLHAPRLPAPLHLAAALLLARGLSLRERAAAVGFMRAQKAGGFRCDSGLSVEALLHNHGQPEGLIRRLWEPLCVSTLNTRPPEASAACFLAALRDTLTRDRDASDLLLPRTDFSALFPEPAGRFVETRGGRLRLGDRVRRLEPGDGFIDIEATDTQRFTHAVLAVGPHQLDPLAAGLPVLTPAREAVAGYRFRPIYSVFLQYPQAVSLPEPMIGFSGGVTQWAFDRGRLCGQKGLIGVVISSSGGHEDLAHDDLATQVHQELQARFGLPAPLWHQVIGEKRATFACTPGLPRPANRTPNPRLFLAGDYTESDYPATLEAAVRSGIRCARMILARND